MAKYTPMESPNREAQSLIDEVEGIKAHTRGELRSTGWQWLTVWSVAFFGAALTALVPAWESIAGFYWVLAVPVALVVTAVISWKVELPAPVRRRQGPYWAVGAGITIAATAASLLLPESAIVVVIWVIMGLGFAGFAWLERIVPAAWLLAAMAVISGMLGMIVADPFALYPVLALAFSFALAGIAAGMRAEGRR
jgi:hypothetical protein